MTNRLIEILLSVLTLLGGQISVLYCQEIFYSKDLQLERYTIKDGYPDDNAYFIMQDSMGYIWISSNRGLIRYDGIQFKIYMPSPNTVQGAVLTAICGAGGSNLWVGSVYHGLLFYDFITDELIHLDLSDPDFQQLKKEHILKIVEDKYGYLWIGTKNGLYRLSFDRSQVAPILTEMKKFSIETNQVVRNISKSTGELISALIADENKGIWIGSNKGLFRLSYQFDRDNALESNHPVFHPEPVKDSILSLSRLTESLLGIGIAKDDTSKFILFSSADNVSQITPFQLENDAIESTLVSQKNELWIRSYNNRLYRIRDWQQADNWLDVQEYELAPNKPWNVKEPSIPIIEDRNGMIWIGSESYGLIKMNPISNRFKLYKYPVPSNQKSPRFREIIELSDSIIILGSDFDGLYSFNRAQRTFSKWNLPFIDPGSSIQAIYLDKSGFIWLGLRNNLRGALVRFQPTTLKFRYFNNDFNSKSVMDIMQSQDSSFWFSTEDEGVFHYKPEKDSFYNYIPKLEGKLRPVVYCVLEDEDRDIWMGVAAAGLHRLTKDDTSQHFLGYQSPWHLTEDNTGNIWAGSPFGLFKLNRETGVSVSYTMQDGIGAEWIYWVTEHRDKLWMITSNGISSFNSTTESFRNWDWEDGLAYQSTIKTGYQLKDKLIVVAVGDALQIFHPDSLLVVAQAPKVHFQSLTIGDTLIRSFIQDSFLFKFKHFQNSLEFNYIGLEYSRPEKITYAHKMEAIDADWILTGHDHVARYAQVSPGQYVFKVKAANRDGIWSIPQSIHFIILPPWYWAWWSKSLYLLILLLAAYGFYRYQLKRQLSIAEADRLRELDTFKSRLYTNITHEFRTPLTVILGLAEQLQEKVIESGQEGLQMISRNGNRLLNLVNQMLDLQKLEADAMPLHMIQGNIVTYLKYLSESFYSYAASNAIQLAFNSNLEKVMMDYDPEKIQNIFSNLVSNALKFTPRGGVVEIHCSKEPNKQFVITIRDNGSGISSEKVPYIFDRFYQADNSTIRQVDGTGIGLALTRELVKLLGGAITVKSVLGAGSEFTVLLPINQNAPIAADLTMGAHLLTTSSQALSPEMQDTENLKDVPQILIIEDNHDVIHYITSILQRVYEVSTAYDGKEGVDQAFESIPDLIISDIMMPQMDGYQVCSTLKQDTRTSHIPIILLTAKADMESKLEGLQFGAEAYVVKPFFKEELLVRIQALLDQKKRLQAHYLKLYGVGTDSSPDTGLTIIGEPENAFVQKVQMVIHEHLNEATFGVEELCRAMAISNSQLYRKLKAHTGLSAHHLIQLIRMSHAQLLLKKTDDTIAMIAYDCGFNDPEYFSSVFRREFGINPSEYRNP